MTDVNQINDEQTSKSHWSQEQCESNSLINQIIIEPDNTEQEIQSVMKLIHRINKENKHLRRLTACIESNSSVINSTFRYYKMRNILFSIITAGPSDHLIDYLIELDDLNDMLKYFKSLAVHDEEKYVTELYNIGRQKLIEESDDLIMKSTNSIPPQELLDLCRSISFTPIDTDDIQLSGLSGFRIIFDWFKEQGFQLGLIDSYATKRGMMVHKSLKLLAEHLRQKSVRRASINLLNVNPCSSSRRSSLSTDTIKEHVKIKINELGRRFVHSPVFGRRESLSKPTLLHLPKMNVHFDFLDVEHVPPPVSFTDNRETNNYKFLLDAFIILLLRDLDLLFYVFENEYKTMVLSKLMELPLTYILEEGQQLCEAIKQLPGKIDTGKLAFFGLFSIKNWFHKSESTLTKFYQESDVSSRYQFSGILLPIFEQSIIECFHLILYEVKNDSSALSEGGGVHPLTIHVFDFIEDLFDYEPMISTIQFTNIEEQKIATDTISLSINKSIFNLNEYIVNLIQSLRMNISHKLKTLIPDHDKTLQAIFLLNNINYFFKRLEHPSLLAIIEKHEPNLRSDLRNIIKISVKMYLKCYTPMITNIQQMFDYDDLHHLSDLQLREHDREQLKTSFSMVNAAIDTLRQQHLEYTVDDVLLRDQLRTQSKRIILDKFQIFYTKFAHKHFTHNPDKYLRYNPSMLDNIIDAFFE
ncbi:unnamed protein product [Adineta steineri]|uniref:Exocyst complex component 7 n=2 Tax=Adineta steineri TaxID=433720 RepID=A0A814FG20_9BILA|nr:unnamed protein product [Adineta steineri]